MAIDVELYQTIEKIVEIKVKDIKVDREEFNLLAHEVRKLSSEVRELASTQKEFAATQKEFAATQKKTEIAIEELSAAQKRTEVAVEELAVAQKKTDVAVTRLARAVGGLSDTIGYGLEDIARVVLPSYLLKTYHIELTTPFERGFIPTNGRYVEFDLYAKCKRNQEKAIILGEVKSRVSKGEVDRFNKLIKKVESHFNQSIIKFIFGYVVLPDALEHAKELDILTITSYQHIML